MIIKSVELENIRSYKECLVEFDLGINFLSGDIGSGKSTILLAIEFALLGLNRTDLQGFQLLRKGEREGCVRLIINDGEREIEIFRRLKKGKSNDTISQENGYIKIDGNLLELSPQELNFQIFDLLNFPKEFVNRDRNLIYRFTVYTPQEQLKEILYSENEKRLEVIRKIFDVDKYKQLRDAASIYVSNIRSEGKLIRVRLENLDKIREELKVLEAESDSLSKDLEKSKVDDGKVKEMLIKLELDFKSIEDKFSEIDEKGRIIDKNLVKIDEAKKRYLDEVKLKEKLEEDLKIISDVDIDVESDKIVNDIKNEKKKYNSFEKERDIVRKEIEKLEQEEDRKRELEIQKVNLDSRIKRAEEIKKSYDVVLTKCIMKDIEVEMKKLETELRKSELSKKKYEKNQELSTNMKRDIFIRDKDVNSLTEKLENLDDLEVCDLCLQEIDFKHRKKLEERYKKSLIEANRELKDFQSEFKKLELELEKSREFIDGRDGILEKISRSSQKRDTLNDRLVEELKKDSEMKIELKEIKKMRGEMEKLKFNSEINFKDKIIQLKNKLEKIEKLFLESNEMIMKLNSKKDKLEHTSERILELKTQIKRNSELLGKLNSMIEKEKIVIEKKGKIGDLLEKIKLSKESLLEKIKNFRNEEREITNLISSKNTLFNEKQKQFKEKTLVVRELEGEEKKYNNLIYLENFFVNKFDLINENIEQLMLTKYYSDFNEWFERYFKDLIEDNELEIRLDDDFSPIIEQNGYDVDIKNLSGGEKSSLAIAYRLGLKKIVEDSINFRNSLNILILDEPTDGFSNEQVDRLGNILRETDLKQTIIVSHDDKVESISENIVRINKRNHISFIEN